MTQDAKRYMAMVLVSITLYAEDRDHAREVISDTLDDDRFLKASVLYCNPKEEGEK